MLSSFWNDFLKSESFEKDRLPVVYSILRGLEPVEMNEAGLILACPSHGVKFFLEKKLSFIEKSLSKYLNKRVGIEFVVLPKKPKSEEPPLLRFQPSIDDLFLRAGLHTKYSFENFAVSSTNQVAHAACQAVSENPGRAYDPLFLYGGVGVGKTHLAQSVARRILEKDSTRRVLFCSSEQFTNELVESIREKATQKFRGKYRRLNLLVIDDVQFIAGKNTVQEEFFHTFNTIVSAGGQIILTSDRSPNEIKGLEDRLRSRFSGGLITDIQPPDFELRTAILLIKAKEKNIEIGIDEAKVIAEQILDSRALEGTLLSIYARVLGKKDRIDLEEVEIFFQDKGSTQIKKISQEDVLSAVCSFYNIKRSQIRSSVRSDGIALPRQILMYLLRKKLKLKYEEIARFLKKKDHTTIIYGAEKISHLLIKDQSFKREVDVIINSLNS